MITAIISGVFGGIKEVDIDEGAEWTINWPWRPKGEDGYGRNIKNLDMTRLQVSHYAQYDDMIGFKHPCPANWMIAL